MVISEDFLPLLRRWGVDEARIAVIENWAPLDELPVLPRDNEWAREHGLADRFVFLYSGTLGFKHDPSLLLELARWARRQRGGRRRRLGGAGGRLARARGRERAGAAASPVSAVRAAARGPRVRGRSRRAARARRGCVLGALEGADVSLRRAAAARLGGARQPRRASRRAQRRRDRRSAERSAGSGRSGRHAARRQGDCERSWERRARSYAETTFDLEEIADRFEQVLERATS